MMSVLPRLFSPNRLFNKSPAPAAGGLSTGDIATISGALQSAASANLGAVLSGQAPVAMRADGLAPLTATANTSRRRAARRRVPMHPSLSVTPPDDSVVASLLHEPGQLDALARPGPHFGAEILLSLMLRHAFSDAVFRHGIAETCRRFMCDRVLFHPGPPPQPDFSVAGLCLLVASQPGHALGPQAFSLLKAAVAEVAEPYRPWDQWLLRQMIGAGWAVSPDVAQLPWVAWMPQAGTDETELAAAGLPAYWASVLELAP